VAVSNITEIEELTIEEVSEIADDNGFELEYDNQGQAVLYTGVYRNGAPEFDDEDEEKEWLDAQ
jgi:hypothetical protein